MDLGEREVAEYRMFKQWLNVLAEIGQKIISLLVKNLEVDNPGLVWRVPVGRMRYTSTVSLGSQKLPPDIFTWSYWPKFSHLATSSCKGNWEIIFLSGQLCFQLKFLLLIEEGENGYQKKLAVSSLQTEARLQRCLMLLRSLCFIAWALPQSC